MIKDFEMKRYLRLWGGVAKNYNKFPFTERGKVRADTQMGEPWKVNAEIK